MNAVPTVLDVQDAIFTASPKYMSSAAMVLDRADGWDASTGDVEWNYHIQAFYNLDVADAYSIVSEFIEQERDSSLSDDPPWTAAKQMIDIISEGSNWLLYTNTQGFVTATCFESIAEAKDAFRIDDEAYSEWLNQDESEV